MILKSPRPGTHPVSHKKLFFLFPVFPHATSHDNYWVAAHILQLEIQRCADRGSIILLTCHICHLTVIRSLKDRLKVLYYIICWYNMLLHSFTLNGCYPTNCDQTISAGTAARKVIFAKSTARVVPVKEISSFDDVFFP